MTIHQDEIESLKSYLSAPAKLSEGSIQGIDDLSEAENEKLWAQEAARRHKELTTDKSKGRPAEEVFREARALIKRRA
jgi:hypothetical protein